MHTSYLIALGSNMRHPRHGPPPKVIAAAFEMLGAKRKHRSQIIASRPIGPSIRTYANAACIIKSRKSPADMLHKLKKTERKFGRRAGGRRWSARVLDLDIILWSEGMWTSPGLGIPHREFRKRPFVLGPASEVASCWRDPLTGFSVRHLKARLDRKRPLP